MAGDIRQRGACLPVRSGTHRDSGGPDDLRHESLLLIHPDFADLCTSSGLTTFEAWFSLSGGESVRQVKQRWTTRIVLDGQAFYLKRYEPLSAREYVRSALRLNWPIHGARTEWEALLDFQKAGLPTATPVAFGERGGKSFVVLKALEGFRSLRDVFECGTTVHGMEDLAAAIGELARRMHQAGLAHQDFYFDHVFVRWDEAGWSIRIIDLGRVRRMGLWAFRWAMKDLAQLRYAATRCPGNLWSAVLRSYLGRNLRGTDWCWMGPVVVKSWWISRHTRRRSL